MSLAGSDSAPFAITAGVLLRRSAASRTAASLRWTGKAAPPRPVRPDFSMSLISAPGLAGVPDAVAVGQVAVPGEVRGQVLRPFAVLDRG